MAVKMKDIASALGVSLVTVSKAMRNHPDISKATRERVVAKVKELNYRPNLMARSLVTGRSSLVGFIVPDLIHPFFAEVAAGLSLALREKGLFLVVSSSEEDPALELQEIEQMLAHRLDAIVVASCSADATALANMSHGATPLILVDRYFENFSAHFVGADDYAAGKLATEHLISSGCKRIAHIRSAHNSTGRRRQKAFMDTMAKHQLPVPDEYVVEARSVDVNGKEHGAMAFRTLHALKRPPEAVFCYNHPLAAGLILEALKMGVTVPGDLAVIGCGNLHYDDSMRVPLSSVDQRAREIGTRTAKLIFALTAEDASQGLKKIILQPKLVVRESSERPVRAGSGRRPPASE